jgi:hypothetical protein
VADATAQIWARLRRPFDVIEIVDALLGLSPKTAGQLASTVTATCPEAEDLLDRMPHILRSLANSVTDSAEECRGQIRGPVLWSETTAARASSGGAQDVFVCATPQRAYDIDENRVLVAALCAIRDAGRGVDSIDAHSYDDDTLRRARQNGNRAIRYLDHRTLSQVSQGRPNARALKRVRSGGGRRATYIPALAMVDRMGEPLGAEDVRPFCDRRTRAQHALIMSLADGLEQRGATLPPFRAFDGVLFSGPIRYQHPRRLGETTRLHGVLLDDVLVDVPERIRDRNRARAEAALHERSGGRRTVVVLGPDDVDRAIDLALSSPAAR